jgi:hypothetical protein
MFIAYFQESNNFRYNCQIFIPIINLYSKGISLCLKEIKDKNEKFLYSISDKYYN